jgi:hypothetical protein
MPTAIVRTYYGDGFIIAADGMARDQNNNETRLDKCKIYALGVGKHLAYSIAGRSKIGPDEGPEIWFDFRERIDGAVASISTSRVSTLTLYAERLKKRICRELTDECSNDKIHFDDAPSPHPGEKGYTLTYVFIDGYYKALESSVIIRFYRLNHRFRGEVFTPGLFRGAVFHSGSTVIQELIKENDPRFANDKYFRPLDSSLEHLSEDALRAIQYSRGYIEACASAEARALDVFCSTIGGDIHMALITEKDGFQWVPGFKPEPHT